LDRRRKARVLLAGLAERPTLGAGEGITASERIEDLAADSARGEGAERSTVAVAVSPCRLDQPDDAPGHQVLAFDAAAPWIERSRSHRPRESEVRDDALVVRSKVHFPLPGGTLPVAVTSVNKRVTELSTIAESYFDRYRYPDWLRTHSRVVGVIAARLAEAHLAAGRGVDVATVTLGGYLHDIGKSPLLAGDERDHHVLGPLILAAEGRPELAELARRHPVYAPRDPATAPRTLAERIVYYADRRAGQRVMSLEARLDEQLARHPDLAHLRAADLAAARGVEREVFHGIELRPEDLAGAAGTVG